MPGAAKGLGIGYTTAAGAPLTDHPRYLTTGELVSNGANRETAMTNVAQPSASGTVFYQFFTALKTESCVNGTMITGSTAAAPTPTVCRYGLYIVDSTLALTLVASTTNDTTLFASTNTTYAKAFTTPYTRIAGQRYAFAVIVVSGAAVPTFLGTTAGGLGVESTEAAVDPRTCATLAAQSNLPAGPTTDASLTAGRSSLYMKIT